MVGQPAEWKVAIVPCTAKHVHCLFLHIKVQYKATLRGLERFQHVCTAVSEGCILHYRLNTLETHFSIFGSFYQLALCNLCTGKARTLLFHLVSDNLLLLESRSSSGTHMYYLTPFLPHTRTKLFCFLSVGFKWSEAKVLCSTGTAILEMSSL